MSRLRVFLLLALAWSGAASAGCWVPLPSPQGVTFTGSQAGAPFPGEFKSYSGLLCLDGQDASKDTLKVEVDTASVATGLPEMDEALQNGDFFDTAHYRRASFESDSFKSNGPGRYSVTGRLTIRDVTRTVTVPFTWTPAADGRHARLEAAFSLKRLDYHVGQGEWADTKWAGDTVELRFSLDFVPAPK